MGSAPEALLEAALKLPEKERARLAAELIASLDAEADAGVDEAWTAEVERRRAAVARGEEKMVPWEQVKAEVRGALKIR